MSNTEVQQVIPPEALRVGVGPFSDPELFLDSALELIELATNLVELRPDDRALDVGCGCGRVALPLQAFLSESGSYVGFDLNEEYVNWCEANIAKDDDRFSFHHIDLISSSYNPAGTKSAADFVFPEIGAIDVAILSSVITHMYPPEIEQYVQNLAKVTVQGGRCMISALLMNDKAKRAVREKTTIFNFDHRVGESCWTFNEENPLDGISCDEQWLCELFYKHGFEIEKLEYGNWREIKSYEIQHDWFGVKKGETLNA